jgi:hypothetical protein
MKNFHLVIFSIAFSISTSAQVHVTNLAAPPAIVNSVMLQVDANNKGVSLPNVALAATTTPTITTPKEGLLVYNTSTTTTNPATDVTPGFYYWYNNAWQPLGKITDSYIFQQKINLAVLGYSPDNTGITADNTTTGTVNPTNGGGNWSKKGCVKWDASVGGNGHTYCAYIASGNRTWEQAFALGKGRGGYLVTITSDTERDWLKTNIIDPKIPSNYIWLGYNKYQNRYIPLDGNNNDSPYNRYRYKWITGEKWTVNWEVSTGATVQHNFASGQPDRVAANGCAYISTAAGRTWDDNDCSNVSGNAGAIIEFQDTY